MDPKWLNEGGAKVLEEMFVQQYYGRIINIHHAFLPAFKGDIKLKPIKAWNLRDYPKLHLSCRAAVLMSENLKQLNGQKSLK